jgi:hypothetical protein
LSGRIIHLYFSIVIDNRRPYACRQEALAVLNDKFLQLRALLEKLRQLEQHGGAGLRFAASSHRCVRLPRHGRIQILFKDGRSKT